MDRISINSSDIVAWFKDPQVKNSLNKEYALLSQTHDLPGDLGKRTSDIAQTAIPAAGSGAAKITLSTKGPPEREIVIDFTSDDGKKLFSIPLEKLHCFPQLLVSIGFFEEYTLPYFAPSKDTLPSLQILKDLKEVQDRAGRDIDFSDLQQAIDAICSDNPDKCKTDNAQENIKFAILVCTLLQFFETPPDTCPRLCAAAIAALESPYFEADSSQPLSSSALLSFASLSPNFEKTANRLIHKYLTSLSSQSSLFGAAHPNFQEIEHISLLDPTTAELAAIKKHFLNVKSLKLKFTSSTSREELNKALRELNRLKSEITSLDLSDDSASVRSGITDTELAYLEGLTALTSLDLSDCMKITDAGIAHLTSLSRLTTLNLSCCRQVTGKWLQHITGLISLNLSRWTSVSDEGLKHIKDLTNLTDLDLGAAPSWRITEAGLEQITGLTALTSLSLLGWEQITDTGFKHVKGLTALVDLNLELCSITDAGLEQITGLTTLNRLNLSRCNKITDAGLEQITGLTALVDLNFGGCDQITDAGLEQITGLTTLNRLNLSSCNKITDAGLAHLASLFYLTHLELKGCNITGVGFEHTKDLTSLTSLILSYNKKVTDAGLMHIKGLTALVDLKLIFCTKITDDGLDHLKDCPALTRLSIYDCSKITQSKADALYRKFHDQGKYIEIEGP